MIVANIRAAHRWQTIEGSLLRRVAQQVALLGRVGAASGKFEGKVLPCVVTTYKNLEGRRWRNEAKEHTIAFLQLMRETVLLACRVFHKGNNRSLNRSHAMHKH